VKVALYACPVVLLRDCFRFFRRGLWANTVRFDGFHPCRSDGRCIDRVQVPICSLVVPPNWAFKRAELVVAFAVTPTKEKTCREDVMAQAQAQTEPKLFLPFLQPLYDTVVPLSWLVVRLAVGWNLLVHGYNKIMTGPTDAFLKAFADLGFTPPVFWFWSSTTIETLAGISLILGLFTRFFAAAAAIEMLIIGQRLRLAAPRL
jgi:DoxX